MYTFAAKLLISSVCLSQIHVFQFILVWWLTYLVYLVTLTIPLLLCIAALLISTIIMLVSRLHPHLVWYGNIYMYCRYLTDRLRKDVGTHAQSIKIIMWFLINFSDEIISLRQVLLKALIYSCWITFLDSKSNQYACTLSCYRRPFHFLVWSKFCMKQLSLCTMHRGYTLFLFVWTALLLASVVAYGKMLETYI